jgi:hypothetical protein
MTLTFLDLYNTAAAQEWSVYDSDITLNADMEGSLVIDLNKAVTEILYSYPFSFRERTHVIMTLPGMNSYSLPQGLILQDEAGRYMVKIGGRLLNFIKNPSVVDKKTGVPDSFYIRGSKIVLYPAPAEKFIITTNYITLAIGEDKNGNEIFSLQDKDDVISVPEYLEAVFKQAVVSRAMLKSIASEGDENYSAYKKQSEVSYRQLVKYSKGVVANKSVKI